jgi:hypothetical protein
LLTGFEKYGGKWSSIQKDDVLGLGHRRSTDLRDRFRNAFPEKYVGAGFKPPPAKRRRRTGEDAPPSNSNNVTQSSSFEFRTDVGPPAPISARPMQITETPIAAPARREQITVGMASSQPSGDTFTHGRLAWTNPHNAMQKEMEMAMKLRRALDMSNATEMMGDAEIPLDPGLSDVAYQPHGQNHDTEALTGLLDAAVQHGSWKRD